MSHVKGHTRVTAGGKTVFVKEHLKQDASHEETKRLVAKLQEAEKYLEGIKKPGMANDAHIAVSQKVVDDLKAKIKGPTASERGMVRHKEQSSIFKKSHVKEYARKTASGKVVMVKEHEDKRAKVELGDRAKESLRYHVMSEGNQHVLYKDGKPVSTHGSHDEAVTEMHKQGAPRKLFSVQNNIGKAKYVVNFHDGEKKHSDGSDFFDMRIFKNKVELERFVTNLRSNGYQSK